MSGGAVGPAGFRAAYVIEDTHDFFDDELGRTKVLAQYEPHLVSSVFVHSERGGRGLIQFDMPLGFSIGIYITSGRRDCRCCTSRGRANAAHRSYIRTVWRLAVWHSKRYLRRRTLRYRKETHMAQI